MLDISKLNKILDTEITNKKLTSDVSQIQSTRLNRLLNNELDSINPIPDVNASIRPINDLLGTNFQIFNPQQKITKAASDAAKKGIKKIGESIFKTKKDDLPVDEDQKPSIADIRNKERDELTKQLQSESDKRFFYTSTLSEKYRKAILNEDNIDRPLETVDDYPTIKRFYDFISNQKDNDGVIVNNFQFFCTLDIKPNASKIINMWNEIESGLRVQEVTLPNFKIPVEEIITNDYGKYVLPSKYGLIPDSNVFQVKFLNTQYSMVEHVLLNWMKEVQSSKYVYPTNPYSIGTFSIDYFNQTMDGLIYRYILHDCYPIHGDTNNPSYVNINTLTKGCNFAFNWLEVKLLNVDDQYLNPTGIYV